MNGHTIAILSLLREIATLLVLFSTAFIYWMIRRDNLKNSIRDATQQIYLEWWSDEMNSLRRYFYREFLPLYRNKLLGMCIKEIESAVPEDKGRIRKFCYFFERVGWLGAAGLIDVDYILGPMQHAVRCVWLAMEPFINEERKPKNVEQVDSVHHSVYMSGFEWLYKRSTVKHQAELVGTKFKNPKLHNKHEIKKLKTWIDEDEQKFRTELGINGKMSAKG